VEDRVTNFDNLTNPCPFCGGEAEIFRNADRDGESYCVCCGDCGARGPLTYPDAESTPISQIEDPEVLADKVAAKFQDFVSQVLCGGTPPPPREKSAWNIACDIAKAKAIKLWNSSESGERYVR